MTEKHSTLLSFILVLFVAQVQAQEHMERTKEVFAFLREGQGDSIYVRMNKDIQENLSPEFWSKTFRQLESQLGTYQWQSEWYTETVQESVLYCSNVQFEKTSLKFFMTFDDDGKANTIRFNMLPPAQTIIPALPKNTEIQEEVIEIVSGNYSLPGTLTLPKNIENPPVTILIHGSGPNDRDETIGPNKPFRDLAWGLGKRGIAVVRYDKRTFVYGALSAPDGKLNYDTETVTDAIAAAKTVRADERFLRSDIYIIGHSLGAMLAPRIANLEPSLSGIVMIAGNARPLENLLLDQMNYLYSLSSPSEDAAQQLDVLKMQVANLKHLETDSFNTAIPLPLGIPESYWKFSVHYNQVKAAQALAIPILLLQGERDYQITMEDFDLWKAALKHNKNVVFKSYPKLNHLLQEGVGKSTPSEYNVANPVADYVLDDIASWIKNKVVN